ncbi:AbiJ-NTD4 domain-containing protein [Lysinibacillus xylanilyticus]|uniref:AbiJ-NTD4 domain-containing protein n=1 Tax=Lysinibacillus xylanilyticus TaxID=582475 RepID=UPI003D00CF91
MNLYTERHGLRKPIERTSKISKEVYTLLLNACQKYYKNLTHIFKLQQHCSFVNQPYIEFNRSQFENRMVIKIPVIFRDDYGRIVAPQDNDVYDQYALIDLIEYVAENIKDISEGWNNDRYRNYWDIRCLNTTEVFDHYQNEINEIFQESGLLFTLTSEKIIERITENTPLSPAIETQVQQIAEYGTRELMKDAIALYKTPNPAARQDSVEKIWDALERLKTNYTNLDKRGSATKVVNDMSNGKDEFITIFDAEFRALTDIGNSFRIRHHETNKIDITDNRHYDYFFNRCLSLIALAIQYLK